MESKYVKLHIDPDGTSRLQHHRRALPEPLRNTPLPRASSKEVAVDFAGPFPSGDYIVW